MFASAARIYFFAKMTQIDYTPRNLYEYARSCKNKTALYKQIKDELDVSMMTAERWCKFYYQTSDPAKLSALSKITGIPAENLFKKFGNED